MRFKIVLEMRKRYPTDLDEREWLLIEKHFRVCYKKGGRPLKHSKREILDAIFYVLRTGCQWPARFSKMEDSIWVVLHSS